MNMRMRTARKAANLTMAALAERVGVSREHVTMIEAGKRTPSLPVASRICQELPGLGISDFVTDGQYPASTLNAVTGSTPNGEAP